MAVITPIASIGTTVTFTSATSLEEELEDELEELDTRLFHLV